MDRRRFVTVTASTLALFGGCSALNDDTSTPSPTPVSLEEFEMIDDDDWWQLSLESEPQSLASARDFHVGTESSLTRISPAGKLRWQVDAEVASLSVVASESTIYYATSRSEIVARNANTGKELWRRRSDRGPRPAHASDSAIVVATDFEEARSAGWPTFALARQSGETLWEVDTGTANAAALTHGLSLILSPEKLYAIETDTGDIKWQQTVTDSTTGPIRTTKDTAYLPSDSGIAAFTLPDGKRAWSTSNEIESIDVTLVDSAVGNVIAGTHDGTLFAVNPSDGETVWSKDVGDLVGSIETTVLENGSGLAIANIGDSIRAFDAATGEQRWHQTLSPLYDLTGPVIVKETVLVPHEPTADSLYLKAFDLVSGDAQWMYQIEIDSVDNLQPRTHLTSNCFFVTTDNGFVYGFPVE